MSDRTLAFRALPLALGISLGGLMTTSTLAQGPDPYAGYNAGPNESLTVTVPRFHEERTPLNGTAQRVSLSVPVNYTTRDLLTRARSERLRWRIWQTAQQVCENLAEAYPFYPMTTARSPHSCARDAYDDAMVKIDARITGAPIAYGF